jgi:hypothetical protein
MEYTPVISIKENITGKTNWDHVIIPVIIKTSETKLIEGGQDMFLRHNVNLQNDKIGENSIILLRIKILRVIIR